MNVRARTRIHLDRAAPGRVILVVQTSRTMTSRRSVAARNGPVGARAALPGKPALAPSRGQAAIQARLLSQGVGCTPVSC